MPPAQCPECGRFLSKTFVNALAVEPAPCPKCAMELSAAHFTGLLGQDSPEGPDEEPAAAAGLRAEQPDLSAEDRSVRPPDLDPVDVGAADRDPLEGWDEGVVDLDRYRPGTAEPPSDLAILAGAAAAGAVAGAVIATGHRARGAGLGALLGAIAAGAARQVWQLQDD